MDKHKASYTNMHKSILIQLLLGVLLFMNCERLDISPDCVDSQLTPPALEPQVYTPTIAYGEEEKPISSSRKRKRLVLADEDKSDQGIVVKKINQETYFGQNSEGFATLPIELQVYILSFLDGKDFHRASLVCQSWREAAFIAGEVKTLDLSAKKLDEKDCQVILKVPFCSLILKECKLGDQEMFILSQSTKTKHLDLSKNQIRAVGLQALADGNLAALTSLHLVNNSIGAEGAQPLASRNFSSLTSLNLGSNRMGPEGAQALASGNLAALTFLDLGLNNIGDAGLQALVSGNLTALTSLHLDDNDIGDVGAQALASGNLAALTSLVLAYNSIKTVGAQALASGNLAALTSLDLYKNKIGDEGAQALASGNLAALTFLNLYNNCIGDEGKKALKAWTTKKSIKLYL